MISRFRRRIRLGLILSLLGGGSYFILATPMGLKQVFRLVARMLSGQLQVSGLQGRLIGPLQFDQLIYRNDKFILEISQLSMNWDILGLFRGYFLLKPLIINRLVFHQKNQQIQLKPKDYLSNFHMPTWMSYFRLSEITLKDVVFRVENKHLSLQGTIGKIWRLSWQLKILSTQNAPFTIKGDLTGNWQKHPHLQLMGRSNPWICNLDSGESYQAHPLLQFPIIQLQAYLNPSGFKFRIESGKNTYEDYATAWFVLPGYHKGFPSARQTVELGIHAGFKPNASWHTLLAHWIQMSIPEWTGKIKLNFGLKGKVGRLQSCLSRSNACFEKHYSVRDLILPPPEMQLSLRWKQPTLLALGLRFENLWIHAKLDHNHIIWQGLLTPMIDFKTHHSAAKEDRPKWNLTGETQLQFIDRKSVSGSTQPLQAATQLTVTGKALPLFFNSPYQVMIAPRLNLTLGAKHMGLTGQLSIPEARLNLTDNGRDIVFLDQDVQITEESKTQGLLQSMTVPFYVNLNLQLGKEVYLRHQGLDTRIEGKVALTGNLQHDLYARGEVQLLAGRYRFYGQQLTLEPGARLIFTDRVDNPSIEVTASKQVWVTPPINTGSPPLAGVHRQPRQPLSSPGFLNYGLPGKPVPVKVGLQVRGYLSHPRMSLFTDPDTVIRSQTDKLAYLVTGQASHELGAAGAQLLLGAASQLGGDLGGGNIVLALQRNLGLDLITIQADPTISSNVQNPAQNMAVVLGKQVTPQLFLSYIAGLTSENSVLKANYLLSRHFSLEGTGSHLLGNSIDLLYQMER